MEFKQLHPHAYSIILFASSLEGS